MVVSLDTTEVKKLQAAFARLADASFTKKQKQQVGEAGANAMRPSARSMAKKRGPNAGIGIFYVKGRGPIYGAIPTNMSKTIRPLVPKGMYGALLGAKMDNSNPGGTYTFKRSGKTIPVFGRTIRSSYASYAYLAYGGAEQWASQLLEPTVAQSGVLATAEMSKKALQIFNKTLSSNGF